MQLIKKEKKKSIKSVCVWKYSDVTPFVIFQIFIINCNLIRHVFLSNYNWLQLHLFCY